ncbi:hypothetical protein GGS20DRAFT_110174 [Poronia punctata]|nr:hypothetical protein GGS20DRAFT_110174 [Poronia punctata]
MDVKRARTLCRVLLDTFQEILRYRAVNPGPRVLLEDVLLNERILLKKRKYAYDSCSCAAYQSFSVGDDVCTFDHMRFARAPEHGRKRPIRVAFRTFDGGHVLKAPRSTLRHHGNNGTCSNNGGTSTVRS